MPSPIGHSLAAAAAGWIVSRPSSDRRAFWIQTATLAAIGSAADLDLLVNRHRAESHSLGAAVIVASIAAWRAWPLASGRSRIWLAAFLAWATHPFLDWLSADASVPRGIMALWPLTTSYYYAGADVFISIWRHWWESGWFTHNLEAVTREILVIAPVTAVVWWWRRGSVRAS